MAIDRRIIEGVLKRFLAAGDVIQFGPKNPHFIKIHGERYYLSDDGGPLGSPDAPVEWAGGARLIVGPGAGKFKYLWVYDTDRQIVAMWRAHDGNEKVWERASSMQQKLVTLDKKRQLNRVTHDVFVVIEREMERAARENEAALKRYLAENESDFQKTVNQAVQRYFDQEVRPDIERAIAAVSGGVVPLGFKPFGNPEDRERQMMTKAMSEVMNRKFTESLVERHLRDQGLDLDSGDSQAVQWAVSDTMYAAFDEYLPERA